MKRYHTNRDGDPGECSAEQRCPFGWPLDQHADTPLKASQRWEAMRKEQNTPKPLRKKTAARKYPRITVDAGNLKKGMTFVRPRDAGGTIYTVLEDADPTRGRVRTDRGLIGFNTQNKLLWTNAPTDYDYNTVSNTTRTPTDAEMSASYTSNGPTPRPTKITALQARKYAATVVPPQRGKNTVLAADSPQENVVELKLSSWYNATLIRKSFEDKGFLAEMGRTPDGKGQWVRIQPMPSRDRIVETTAMDWDQEASAFVVDASVVNKAPRYLRSARTNEVIEMQQPNAVRDGNGSVTHWEMTPISPRHNWSVRVLNS